MKVWMLIILTFSYSAFSRDFTHLKLNPEFERYLNRTESKSNLQKALTRKSLNAVSSSAEASAQNTIHTKMMGALLGTSTLKSNMNNPIQIDGENSPLYDEIRRHLETAHQGLGSQEVQNINRWNQQFNLGNSNFAGFSWQKPFGVVQVQADRQVTPNIFGQNWLVMDTFTFEVEATTFLEKLAEAGLSGLSATEIGAFAGITFRRVYTYWHYANSYQEGLTADFSRLFLPFLRFNQNGMERMNNEEIMKREDLWTASAGGLISTPPLYNISFSAGVLASYAYQNTTTVQSQHNSELRYKVGVLGKATTTAGATLELQLNFFNLLKLSLLRYDMNYEYSSGKEFTLGFKPDQWQQIKADNEQGHEFRSIMRGFGSVKKLEPYIVRLDESSSSAIEQRGSILIWGKMQKQKTETIRAIKDNVVRVFFKNYAQNVKVVQNIFSRLFSAIVYKIFKLPVGVNNAAIYSRQVTMEYEATHPQASDPQIARIDSSEQFSFVLTQYYNASRTDRWVDKRFKNDLIWFVDHFTTLPKNYKTDIRNEVLKGPMLIESNLRVEKAGFQYLLATDENQIFAQLVKVCQSKKKDQWTNELTRKEMLEDRQSGKDGCVKDLGLNFLTFKYDYIANHLKPSLAKFKDFITKYYKKSETISDLQVIFGEENTFINGKLQAQTSMGMPFNTTFSSGQFRGLGVIDTFKRTEGSRVPASIVSE